MIKCNFEGFWLCSDGTASHFNIKETQCPCGCGFNSPSQLMIDKMENQRRILNNILKIETPIYILKGEGKGGWCRCEKYNKDIGGADKSGHLKGNATDCFIKGNQRDFYRACEMNNWNGIGSYPESSSKMLHLDAMLRFSRWVYRKGKYHYLF